MPEIDAMLAIAVTFIVCVSILARRKRARRPPPPIDYADKYAKGDDSALDALLKNIEESEK